MTMKKKYYLSAKRRVVIIVLNFTLLSCSGEQDNSTIPQAVVDEQVKKEEIQEVKDKATAEHWFFDKKGHINPKLNAVNRPLDDQEAGLLEADRKESEIELHHLIQEMDDNLDNLAVREELAEKMQQSTVEYKQKMLLLAKDKLKKQ